MSDEPILLTQRQVVRLLQMRESDARDLIRRGVIPSIPFGRRRRVPRFVLEGWIRGQIERPEGRPSREAQDTASPRQPASGRGG